MLDNCLSNIYAIATSNGIICALVALKIVKWQQISTLFQESAVNISIFIGGFSEIEHLSENCVKYDKIDQEVNHQQLVLFY